MKAQLLSLCAVAQLLLLGHATGQTQGGPVTGEPSVQGNWVEFERVVKGRFGSEQPIDLQCQSAFDSANPVSMLAELSLRRGFNRILERLPLGNSAQAAAQQRRQEDEWLRNTARHKVWMPVPAESFIGSQLHESLAGQGSLIAEDQLGPRDAGRLAHIRDLASKMIDALPKDQPYQFRIFATNERAASFSAHMGGHLYVSEGLLRDRSLDDADLVLRIAHEISHVTKRHVLRDFQTKLVDAYTLGNQTDRDLRNFTDPMAAFKLVSQRLSLAKQLARTFDHHNEIEADSCAVWLAGQVISPEAISGAIDRFVSYQSALGGRPFAGSIHPHSELRAQVMRMQLAHVRNGRRSSVPDEVARRQRKNEWPASPILPE